MCFEALQSPYPSTQRVALTVHVPFVPLALHCPIGEELEVVSAIHAVEPSEAPKVQQGHPLFGSLLQHFCLSHPLHCRDWAGILPGARPLFRE